MTKTTKKTTKEEKQEEVNIDEMEEMSGERETKSAPKYTLPSVKLNGKIGSFFRTIIEDGELKTGDDGKAVLEDMGESVSGIILKVRKTYFSDGTDSQLYTNEIGNGKNERLSVFSKSENTKGGYNTVQVFAGTPAQVKERFPEISMIQIIYFLLEDTGEIVRLKVKGMSLGQLFDYWKEFERDEHIFEFITELGLKKDKNKFGSFYVNTFKKGKPVKKENMPKVQTAMKEVYDRITEIADYFASRDSYDDVVPIKDPPYKPDPNGSPEDSKPLKKFKDEEDEDIDVDKIPF